MIVVYKKKALLKNFLILCAFVFFIKSAYSFFISKTYAGETSKKSYIAIVIDDFGYNGEGTNEMLNLSIPITGAVLPFSDNTEDDYKALINAGKETIIHMPMEALTGNPSWLGKTAIKANTSDEEENKILSDAINKMPETVGINNHMGSKIMETESKLKIIMEKAADNNLIFLDSKTGKSDLAEKLSKELGVLYLKRDVFLDSTNDINLVKKNIMKTAKVANEKGYAIAIGHVGPEGGKITASALAELAPELEKNGYVFVTLSQLNEILKN